MREGLKVYLCIGEVGLDGRKSSMHTMEVG